MSVREKSNKEYRTWQMHFDRADPSISHWSLIRNGLHGWVAVRKPFLRKGNREKRLRYAKWHKNWTVNQWQEDLWSDEFCPEPGTKSSMFRHLLTIASTLPLPTTSILHLVYTVRTRWTHEWEIQEQCIFPAKDNFLSTDFYKHVFISDIIPKYKNSSHKMSLITLNVCRVTSQIYCMSINFIAWDSLQIIRSGRFLMEQ